MYSALAGRLPGSSYALSKLAGTSNLRGEPQPQLMGAQMLGSLRRPFGELEQVQVNLHGCHAVEPSVVMFAAEDAYVIRADQPQVRILGCPPDAKALGSLPRVAVDVNGHEPEAGELVHHPGCWQPSERVVDVQRLQALSKDRASSTPLPLG